MTEQTKSDYKDTLFLPKTDFPMRAGLPQKEPDILKKWNGLYKKLREQSKGKKPYILHDGPPYANGNLHIGHALNKILKDVVIKTRQMMGYNANYVPGWDCHGLPIEWKIEEEYRKKSKNKDEVPILEFRKECRDFAAKWLDIQKEEFKRLGIIGDWDNPYSTMNFKSESIIAGELLKFATSNQLYRSSKPVYWSCVEKTALADAEVEYHDHESHTIWVKFLVEGQDKTYIVIWTTTPWTIPANLAIAYSTDISYGMYEITQETADDNWGKQGEKYILADARAADVFAKARIAEDGYKRIGDFNPQGIKASHPFKQYGERFAHLRQLIAGDFVTDDAGTGFVHIAPGHGEDDYGLWVHQRTMFPEEYKFDLPYTVEPDGSYHPSVPKFWQNADSEHDTKNTLYILNRKGGEGDANKTVIESLIHVGGLLARGKIKHSYPHSWRSKAPVIYRNTPQWFISMGDHGENDRSLRQIALEAIDQTWFIPEIGKNRIRGMVASRPDWVISRQRAWGVPIALIIDKESGKIVNDDGMNQHILELFAKEGADIWFDENRTKEIFSEYDTNKHEKIMDILDVWFDSGCTHAFVLEEREDLQSPADLYLEGSDQHRGWFHSSLLESCGTREHAPYKAVLTHGFVLDEKGEKMSKSKGNVTTPQEIIKDFGADILRLWVITSDFTDDLRIGKQIINTNVDAYRRLRNSLRWLLGALDGFNETEKIDIEQSIKSSDYNSLPMLERWVLHRLYELDSQVRSGYDAHEYSRVFNAIFQFLTNDLSAYYFDIRKDSLYCDAPSTLRRRACRTILDHLFECLTKWLAPILSFTMEEVWQSRFGDVDSIHLQNFPKIPEIWHQTSDKNAMQTLRQIRRVVTGALEEKRANKDIGSSLEAKPIVYLENPALAILAQTIDLSELCITSGIEIRQEKAPDNAYRLDDVKSVAVVFAKAIGEKCERCWQVLPDVGTHSHAKDACGRCADAITEYRRDAA